MHVSRRRFLEASISALGIVGVWGVARLVGTPGDGDLARIHRVAAEEGLPVPPGAPGLTGVAEENQRPGSRAWQVPWPGHRLANDAAGQIKGYASATSVSAGEQLAFHVSTAAAGRFSLEVYRLGWYAGLGGRLVWSAGWREGIHQPRGRMDPHTGELTCPWEPSVTLTVPGEWVSGTYVAVLTSQSGFQNAMPFVVRSAAASALLVVVPTATYQAYNNYPAGAGGKSLYDFNSQGHPTGGGGLAAVRVSYDRPYSGDGTSTLYPSEAPLVRWVERMGFDVTYATDTDLSVADLPWLAAHRMVILSGHDEYWDAVMFDHLEQLRDAGVSLAFLGANDAGWQMRLHPSPAGVPDRVQTVWRDPALDPVRDRRLATTMWCNAPVGRSPQPLMGVYYGGIVAHPASWVVRNADHWVYAGTGVRDGTVLPGLIDGETDTVWPKDPDPVARSRTVLAASPFRTHDGRGGEQNAVIYQAPSGAWVFSVGTLLWPTALDQAGPVGNSVRTMTHNVIDRVLGVRWPGSDTISSGIVVYGAGRA
ncbi:MAG: N,N-dimethylformamidase beta subunit family domain-containing protein, partial [Actinomycetes bacterium]